MRFFSLGQRVGIESVWRRPERRTEKKVKGRGMDEIPRPFFRQHRSGGEKRYTVLFFRLSARCLGLATAPCSGMVWFYRHLVAKDAPNRGEFVISARIVNNFNRLQIPSRSGA